MKGQTLMPTLEPTAPTKEDLAAIAEKKRVALNHLSDAWDSAIADGVDPDILAHAALFTALCDLVAAYGEEPVAQLAGSLPQRIRAMEFSIDEDRTIQ
jgi:L-alanine-DL-glutamate epimerase-like enolase superfamily enzyme